jgi:LAS superfamily LD-carboxypeptidase LdcB
VALAQLIKQGVIASVNNKKEQMKDSIKESVMSMPLIGSILKKRDDDKKQKEDGQLQVSFTKISDTSNQQVQILKQSNIILTQISDNVYNIAGKLGAELSSLEEVKQIFKDRAKQEAIDKQKASGQAEESSLEARQAIQLGQDNKPKAETKKETGGLFDFLKSGKLPIKDIIKAVLRGLTLFTNPIGIAVAIVGTIGYGIYKYFTDDEFKDTVDNLFESAKKFIAEKFSQAGDLFSQYIVDPVVNFLSGMKDKVIEWLVSVLKPFENVPGVGKLVKPSIEALEKMKSTPKTVVPTITAEDQKQAVSETDRLASRYPAATDKQAPVTPEQNAALEADITKYVNLKDSSIDLAGMDPAVKKRLAAVAYEYFNNTGKKIQINSAFRDPKEQAELFAKYGSPRAARPGKSKHEVGLAVDMNSADANKAIGMGLFDKYGFQRPIAAEPWHVEAKEARNSVPDNPTSPGQAVLVSNAGKPTIPSDGVPVNDNQLKQATPAGGGAGTAQTASDLPSAEPVKTESGVTTNTVTESASAQPSSASSSTSVQPSASSSGGSTPSSDTGSASATSLPPEPSSGNAITQASMDVEQGYGKQQPVISNIDNSSSSMSSTEQGTRFKIPSPVANRGSLDKMSFSYA